MLKNEYDKAAVVFNSLRLFIVFLSFSSGFAKGCIALKVKSKFVPADYFADMSVILLLSNM